MGQNQPDEKLRGLEAVNKRLETELNNMRLMFSNQ
jgi:hypothetical protein